MLQSSLAIKAALECNWKRAIEVNQAILKEQPKDIDALNRLGFAYLKLGEAKRAKKIFEKVLKIDPFNPIALKNLKKLKVPTFQSKSRLEDVGKTNTNTTYNNHHKISPDVFLEQPGLTKTVNLVNLANKSVLSHLHSGQKVILIPKKNKVEVRSEDNIYLGVLPDDLSFRLRKLIRLGNAYCAFIKAVDEQQLMIIIREVKRGKRVKDASFLIKLLPNYHTSIRSELLTELLEDTSSEEADKDAPDSTVEEEE